MINSVGPAQSVNLGVMRWRLASLALCGALSIACTRDFDSLFGVEDASAGGSAGGGGGAGGAGASAGAGGVGAFGGSSGSGGGGSDACAPQTYRDAVLCAGPLAYWRLGDVSAGTVASDEMATGGSGGHPGVYEGAPVSVPGAVDGDPGARFPYDSYVQVTTGASDFAFLGVAAFTIEAWIMPEALDAGDQDRNIVGRYSGGSSATGWEYFINFDSLIPGVKRAPGAPAVSTAANSAVPLDSEWHHVVTVFTGSQQLYYLNGAPDGITPDNTAVDDAVGELLEIGGTTTASFLGSIDEVAIYPRPLSPSEVLMHCCLGVGLPATCSSCK